MIFRYKQKLINEKLTKYINKIIPIRHKNDKKSKICPLKFEISLLSLKSFF